MSTEKMSANLPKAVVLAAFVNDPGKNLESLDQEREEIAKELGKNNDDFEFMVIQDATSENLWDHFSEYGKRIVAFHFAGHADGKAEKIILKDEAGNNRGTLMEALADAEGLLPMLQLVFLNGCATSSGVRHFTSHKKLVIATRAPVHDSIAKTFSVYFWKWLTSNPSDNIITAFDYAKSRIKDLDPIAFKERFRDKTGVIENDETLVNQWDLYGLDKYDGSTQLFRGAYFASQLRVGSQKLYEENPLDKRLQQKGEELSHTFFDLSVVEQQTGHKANLIETLQRIYNHPVRHSMLLSAGGGGKTISLVNVWKHHLEEGIYPIPIFIRLNEINDCSGDAREDFISWYIATKYLGLSELTPDTAVFLKEWLSSDWKKPYPKLLLLLDGFNEITAGRSVEEKLLTDLKNRWRGEKKVEAQGIQIVVSSRYESDQAWTHGFARLEIQPIDETAVQRYLGTKYPTEGDLKRLILNPLMLALYSASSTTWEQYKDNRFLEFKNQITNVAELMWNYLETQVVKQFVMYENKESLNQAAHFFLKHFFSYLGFQMERQGLFQLRPDQLEEIIVQAKEQFLNPQFIKVFPRYKIGIREIDLEPYKGFVEETERLEGWIKRLVSRFHFLEVGSRDQKGNPASYSFIHQNFRDFFSAIHLRNLMEIGIYQNKILPEIHNRTWPAYLRQMVGKLEINQYHKPVWNNENKSWERDETPNENTLLLNYLNLYKNEFDETAIEYGIWNTIETWKWLNLDLSGIDLSNLNLAGVNLNKLVLSKKGVQKTLSANFNGSQLDFNSFMANGHFGSVVCVIHHPVLPDIISSDSLGVIKVWSMNTMNCILTIKAHSSSANKIVFNESGASVISCSENGNIKEWDYSTGKLIKTFEKEHEKSISDIRLKSNGEFLVSASLDTQIKIWNIKTGECVKTLNGHKYGVTSLSMHPNENYMVSGSLKGEIFQWVNDQFSLLFTIDEASIGAIKYNKTGDKILVGTSSGIAVEYSITENKILNSFPNHNGDIFDLLYDRDEASFFTASWEYPKSKNYKGTVRQWSLKDNSLMIIFEGHSARVLSLSLVPFSNKLLSSGYDRNIYEWSIETGRKINEFPGTSFYIWDLILHPFKENTVVFCGTDHIIREWDLKSNMCRRNYVGHHEGVSKVLFSSDGEKMYSGSYDRTIRVWSTESGECLRIIDTRFCVQTMAISPDGQFMLIGEYNEGRGIISEVDLQSGKLLKVYQHHNATVTLLEYLPNGKEFVSYSPYKNRFLLLWEKNKERPKNGFSLGSKYAIDSLSIDKNKLFVIQKEGSVEEYLFDFNLFATGNTNWDLLFKAVQRYEGHRAELRNLYYYPEFNRILTSSLVNTKEWSTKTGACLNTYEADINDLMRKEGNNGRALYYGDKNNIVGVFSGEIIYIWERGVKEPIQSIAVQPGIFTNGLDLTNVKWKNELSDSQKKELEMYGAIL